MLPHGFVAKMYGCQSQKEKKLQVFSRTAFHYSLFHKSAGGSGKQPALEIKLLSWPRGSDFCSCLSSLATLVCATLKPQSEAMPLPVPIFFKIKLTAALCNISWHLNYPFKLWLRSFYLYLTYMCQHVDIFIHTYTLQCSNMSNIKKKNPLKSGINLFCCPNLSVTSTETTVKCYHIDLYRSGRKMKTF